MPIYEYCCPACKLKFELMRSISASGEGAICPRCQKKAGRVLSAFASFSKDSGGSSTPIAGGGGGGCAGCGASSCAGCH